MSPLIDEERLFEDLCYAYMDLYERLPFAKDEIKVLGQIGCSFISGLSRRSMPAGPNGIR
jgi:hypothetical protein